MKTFLNIIGSLLIVASILFVIFCAALDDSEVEGASAATPVSAYFISSIPGVIGILVLIISNKMNKKEEK